MGKKDMQLPELPELPELIDYEESVEDKPSEIDTREQVDILLRNEALKKAIATLTEREQGIIFNYFYLGKTFSEIARIYHICRERISQIQNKALRKLRHSKRAQKIEGFFDGKLYKKPLSAQEKLNAKKELIAWWTNQREIILLLMSRENPLAVFRGKCSCRSWGIAYSIKAERFQCLCISCMNKFYMEKQTTQEK